MRHFGVVVINYNYGRFLERALSSVLGQTLRPASVLVVDDGSTDETFDVVRRYANRVSLIRQAHAGHVAAFQTGFAAVKADAVLFLDADDYLYEDCLQEVSNVWLASGISKVQYQLDTVDALGQDQGMRFPHFPLGYDPARVRQQAWAHGIYPWTVSSGNVYAADYLRKVLPIDSVRFPKSPDGYVNKLAPLFGDVISIRKPLGAYRVHGTNLWAQSGCLNPKMINTTVALDISLDEEFIRRARLLKAPIDERTELITPQHLEYRLLGLILAPELAPVRSDTRFGLVKKAVHGLRRQKSLSLRARLLWMVWLTVLAGLPRRTAERAYLALRSQSGRAGVANRLVAFSRSTKGVAQHL